MDDPQPFTDHELAQARNAPLGWTARRWLATVDALRAAQPDAVRAAVMAVLQSEEWRDLVPLEYRGMIAVEVAEAVAGSATPTGDDDE